MADNNQVLEFIKESFKLKEQGFYKPAIEMLYKALTIENNNIEILSELAELYYLLGIYYILNSILGSVITMMNETNS